MPVIRNATQHRDTLHGQFSIQSPILVELIQTPSIERLKGIAQNGLPSRYYHLKGYSRYEHSLGVMRLLERLGATEEEVIAGLLHDVSHTAFSHTIDWVVGDHRRQNFQDHHHAQFLHASEIPSILNKYGFDMERIGDESRFSLLERAIPDVCADRIDYALREFPNELAHLCLAGLLNQDGLTLFHNQETARVFAQGFLHLQRTHWGGFEAVSRIQIAATMFRRALQQRLITFEDFWKDDEHVLEKIRTTRDPICCQILEMLHAPSLTHLPRASKPTQCKFRYVDPLFLMHGNLVRLSHVDGRFREEIETARKEHEAGVFAVDIHTMIGEHI